MKLLKYYLKNEILKLNEKMIKDDALTRINHFYKCIQITNDKFLTSDNKYITIWSNKEEIFTIMKKIKVNITSFDILLANSEYFISSQLNNKEISLFNFKNFDIIKKIPKIDCLISTDTLYKIKDNYIIINCKKGIALLYIRTKEIIHYIENFYSDSKRISCDDNNNIYILSNNFRWDYNIKIIMVNIISHEIRFIRNMKKFLWMLVN